MCVGGIEACLALAQHALIVDVDHTATCKECLTASTAL